MSNRSEQAPHEQQHHGRQAAPRRQIAPGAIDEAIADEEKGTEQQSGRVAQRAVAGANADGAQQFNAPHKRPSSAATHTTPAAPRASANPAVHASAETMNNATARLPTNAEPPPDCRGRSRPPQGRSIRPTPGATDTSQCHTSTRVRSPAPSSSGSKWPRLARTRNPLDARNIWTNSTMPRPESSSAGLTRVVHRPTPTIAARITSAYGGCRPASAKNRGGDGSWDHLRHHACAGQQERAARFGAKNQPRGLSEACEAQRLSSRSIPRQNPAARTLGAIRRRRDPAAQHPETAVPIEIRIPDRPRGILRGQQDFRRHDIETRKFNPSGRSRRRRSARPRPRPETSRAAPSERCLRTTTMFSTPQPMRAPACRIRASSSRSRARCWLSPGCTGSQGGPRRVNAATWYTSRSCAADNPRCGSGKRSS